MPDTQYVEWLCVELNVIFRYAFKVANTSVVVFQSLNEKEKKSEGLIKI